jgi:tetratricopeptide (TPR) repeat protein
MHEAADDDLAVGLRLIREVAEIDDPVAQREAVDGVWDCEGRLGDQGRYVDALRLVDGLLDWLLGQEPSGWPDAFSELRGYIAIALYWKGWSLYQLERWPEAVMAFGELIAEADAVPASARWYVACAFGGRGDALWMMGKRTQAAEAYAEGIAKLGDDEDAQIAAIVEELTVNRALLLAKLERTDEAMAAVDGVIARRNPLVKDIYVTEAYELKATLLVERREYDAAMSTIDTAVKSYGSSDDPKVRFTLARLMSDKVRVLKYVGQADAASQAAEQLVNRYGADLDPRIERIVAPHAHRLGRGRSRLRFPGLG